MIWGGFSYVGKLPLAWISTKTKACDYIEMLEISLVEYGEELMGENFVFQQDNASIHAAKVTKCWLQERNIDVLEWPAVSPDLNPIENLWGILARQVYRGGRQFKNSLELKNRIRGAWQEISIETLQNLINSMPKRMFDVVLNKGKQTKY